MRLYSPVRFLATLAFISVLLACGPVPSQSGGAATAIPSPPTASPVPAVPPQPTDTPVPTVPPQPTARPTPAPAVSLLEKNTLLTIYGRAFGVAPILGRLGSYDGFEMMARDLDQFITPIQKVNGGKGVVPTVHLIYGLAIPCEPNDDCLLYLEGMGGDIVKDYIEPAAQRGWQVVLDTQLGRSDPVEQVRRMIKKGYLKYDNVHVAIDPEFHSVPGHDTPGIPIGTVEAAQINEAQQILDDYVKAEGLKHKKVLIVHQFGDPNVDDGVPYMIRQKKELKTFKNVDLVIDADGFGGQDIKVKKYNLMTDAQVYPFIQFRGIKVFLPNPWEQAGHYDKPPMNMSQVFGEADTENGLRMATKPDVVIIA